MEVNNAENLQRMAVGSIHEVSFDPEAAVLLGQMHGGILDKIHALTAHKNEKTGL